MINSSNCYVKWLELVLRFIAENKTDRPQELARQALNGHVWLPEWKAYTAEYRAMIAQGHDLLEMPLERGREDND